MGIHEKESDSLVLRDSFSPVFSPPVVACNHLFTFPRCWS